MAADPRRTIFVMTPSSQPSSRKVLSQIPRVSTMKVESQRPSELEGVIPALMFWAHFGLAVAFLDEGRFDDA